MAKFIVTSVSSRIDGWRRVGQRNVLDFKGDSEEFVQPLLLIISSPDRLVPHSGILLPQATRRLSPEVLRRTEPTLAS